MKLDIEHKDIIKTTKFIIERKTFYIYKFSCKDDTKIKLIIVDGIKTDPPLANCLKNAPKYNEIFTIPSGIINTYHSSWLDPKQDKTMINETTLVCTKRDDLYAIQQYKKYLLTKVDKLKSIAKQLSQDARIAKKNAKEYEDFVNSLNMTIE